MADNNSGPRTIPVTEDVLVVGRRTVDVGTVRVSKTTETRQAIVDEPVITEELHIERRRLDRFVSSDEPPPIRTEGDTTVIPVLEEVLVVEKRLMLREEVRITRVRRAGHSPQEVELRRERVHVERSASAADMPPPFDRSSPDESDQQEQK
jgi:uncharacterized protein (TIGR02271 family)